MEAVWYFQNFIVDGCPCDQFNCDLLNELAESCLNLTQNENYQFCYEQQRNALVECLDGCEVYDCTEKCNEKFGTDLQKCPCAPQCPCKPIF